MREKKYLKVLHISPGFTGGIATHINNIVIGSNSEKIINDVAAFPADKNNASDFISNIKEKKGQVFDLKSPKDVGILKFIHDVRCIVKHNGPYEMVHIHMHGVRLACISIAVRLAGVRRIASHAHIANGKESERIVNKIKHRLDLIITNLSANEYISCSTAASEYVFGKKKVKKNIILHVPNSVDFDKFKKLQIIDKNEFLSQYGCDSDTIIVGHVGYFGYQKNHLFMLDLIKEMKEMNIKFIWLFVGIGEGMVEIKKQASINNIDDSIVFMGFRKDIPELLNLMDIMVLPSIFEGLPTVAIEAQAAGTPCILSTNISKECNMDMKICKFLSLEASKMEWINEILFFSDKKITDINYRKEKLMRKKFTTVSAAHLYEKYIYKKITHFELMET